MQFPKWLLVETQWFSVLFGSPDCTKGIVMDIEGLFSLSSATVMPFWLLMIVLPYWRVTRRIMQSPLVALLPALLYAALVLPQVGSVFAAVSNPTLAGIAALLGTPQGALIGWAHFLAFDLLIGRWAYLDSQARTISAFVMAPVLFLTLMLGPVGFLLYLGVRAFSILRRGRVADPTVSTAAQPAATPTERQTA